MAQEMEEVDHAHRSWLAECETSGPAVSRPEGNTCQPVVTEETKSFWLNAERICESLQLQSGLFI